MISAFGEAPRPVGFINSLTLDFENSFSLQLTYVYMVDERFLDYNSANMLRLLEYLGK